MPTHLVEVVRRVARNDLATAYETGVFGHEDEKLPFFWAGALMEGSDSSSEMGAGGCPVLILRSAGQRVALQVDEVLGNQEVVIKNLGPQLSRLAGLAGMSILPSGSIVLIYNPVALAAVFGQAAQLRQQAAWRSGGQPPGPGVHDRDSNRDIPLVLVVDDSITVRRVTQRLLKREGYRVALAADGVQALEMLAQETPAVMLSDIEMPRMDGFELLRNVRSSKTWEHLPVIMITSRIADKHRVHAQQLGVSHYLGKPYPEDELLRLVAQYSRATA